MDSKTPPQIPLITVVPPKSAEEINASLEKIIKRKIVEVKKWSDILQKIAHEDALQKRKVFLEKHKFAHQAFLSFTESINNLRQIMRICPSLENVEIFSSLCSFDRDIYSLDMGNYFSSDPPSTPPSILTKRTRTRTKKRKRTKKMIQKEKPLEVRSHRWTHDEKRRLKQCGKEMNTSLEPEKFYGELYLRFSPTAHSVSSVRRQAVDEGIKPDIWLKSSLNKSLN